jgi:hypothetical protein
MKRYSECKKTVLLQFRGASIVSCEEFGYTVCIPNFGTIYHETITKAIEHITNYAWHITR